MAPEIENIMNGRNLARFIEFGFQTLLSRPHPA